MSESLPGQSTELGKNILKYYGTGKLDGLNHTDFFQTSTVQLGMHINLSEYGIPNLSPHLRGFSSEISLPIRSEFYYAFVSILQQTFEAGYEEIEQSEDPFVKFAAQHAFVGHEQTLREAVEPMGDNRITRTLQIVNHFTQVRFLQALIAESKEKSIRYEENADTFQVQVWQNQLDDHLTAAGILLMRDAEPQVRSLTDNIINKINALKASSQQ